MKHVLCNKRKLKAIRKAVKELNETSKDIYQSMSEDELCMYKKVEGFSFYKLNFPALPAILAVS